nr:class I SAM-dependent methyltransferase [Micromonospora sp. DSM 115978]
MFLRQLAQELLPTAPEVEAVLQGGAKVADIGCGAGWSSIALALGYPEVVVDGFDPDVPSVLTAERHADTHGVADRVRFHALDAASAIDGHTDRAGSYDLAFAFECVHDMADPVAVLAAARALVG